MTLSKIRAVRSAAVAVVAALGVLAAVAGAVPASANDPKPPRPPKPIRQVCTEDWEAPIECPRVCVGAGGHTYLVRLCPDVED